tara:strand:+ start:59 stop:781 length:723 start_codon:yes stop_codon:yes gene_type:complete
MSAKSDKFEKDIADSINSIKGVNASRPSVGVDFSDVKVTKNNKSTWVEVKMSHKDNLANPRVFYMDGSWKTTYKTPAAKKAIMLLNRSINATRFVENLSQFSGIPIDKIFIPTTKGGLKNENAVPLQKMKDYVEQAGNRYIMKEENQNLGKLITEHYTQGKTEPAYYMQAGDDFYRISNTNPFNLSTKIPLLSGTGDFKVRVSTRSNFYEVQAEIKIIRMPDSNFSFKPGTSKTNPFFGF